MADSEQGPIADDHPPQEEEGKAEKEEPVAPPEQPQVEPQVEKAEQDVGDENDYRPPPEASPPEGPPPEASPPEGPPPEASPAASPPPKASPPEASAPANKAPSPQERKARDLIDQAEKKVKSASTFFGKLFGGAAKLEEGAELYVRAANSFKMAKRYTDAGNAFRQAAGIHMQLDVKHEAASILADAGQVLKKEDPKEAATCYQSATEIYTDMGRFSLAARYHSEIGGLLENSDPEKSMQNYEQAADLYKGEDSTASANKCLLKVAHMSALLLRFEKAAEIFEEVGRESLDNTLLKYGAKDYFFKAAVCRFCISLDEAKRAVRHYLEVHPGFQGTRELDLLDKLMEAVDEGDADKFGDYVKDYDSISRIDQWLTAQLLHIRKAINAIPDLN